MQAPLPDWDAVDESSDASFPASDPPSQAPARRDHLAAPQSLNPSSRKVLFDD